MPGVYPVFNLQFKISTTGVKAHSPDPTSTMANIAELETFTPSFDGNVEEWNPMEAQGWVRRMVTGKSLSISIDGKRNEGDAGNDYIAGLAMKTGSDVMTTAAIVFPDGSKIIFNCVVNVGQSFGGDAINVSGLSFDLLSDGKPTVIS